MRADGSLFIGGTSYAGVGDASTITGLRIELTKEFGGWQLRLGAFDRKGIERAATFQRGTDSRELRGAIGIVCNDAPCRIGEWQASGPKLDAHDNRAFDPILFTQYTLSRRVMKITAQMAPVGPSEQQEVRVSVRAKGSRGAW